MSTNQSLLIVDVVLRMTQKIPQRVKRKRKRRQATHEKISLQVLIPLRVLTRGNHSKIDH